jgi:hypothetical protein
MRTPRTTFRRRLRRGALALAVSAICLPAAVAVAAPVGDTETDYPGSAGYVGTHFPVAPEAKVGDTPADFPGTPGSPVVVSEPASTPQATGFDWTSAALGAAGGGLLVVVSLGGAAAASHFRMRTVRS